MRGKVSELLSLLFHEIAHLPDYSQNMPFSPLRIASELPQTLSVAVALRASTASKGPLAGIRLAVKDLYSMKGLTNSLCSRAYYRINRPSLGTANSIQSLLDHGAQVVGMTKLSSLISREEPTEAVDFQTPFNPRGDGYQSPAGSSSGSAVAVASYPWLDLAIGTDTSGSGRRPALVNGIYQFRPSHDLISLEGLIPTFTPWDTPCIFGRDLTKFPDITQAWYDPPWYDHENDKPFLILYPEDLAKNQAPAQRTIIESFVHSLEAVIGAKAQRTPLADIWQSKCPNEVAGQPLASYLEHVVVQTYYRDFYDNFTNFRDRYREKFQEDPYVNSFVHWRWQLGKQVTDTEHGEGLERLRVYRSWLLQEVLRYNECNPLLILPLVHVQPNYRDTFPEPPEIQIGSDPLFISPILGAPDVVLQLDEVKFISRITGSAAYLPVGVDIVGAPNHDLNLMKTCLRVLQESGRPTRVLTGRRLFEPHG